MIFSKTNLAKPWSYVDWIPIMLMSFLFIGSLFFFCSDFAPSERFTKYNKQRIQEFSSHLTDQHISIVILGNSLAKYGLYEEKQLEQLVSEKLKKPVKVLTIYRSSGVFADFGGFSQDLVSLNPTLFIVQRDFLGVCYGMYIQKMAAIKYWYWSHFRSAPWSIYERDLDEDQFVIPKNGKKYDGGCGLTEKVATFLSYRFSTETKSRKVFDHFYAEATQGKSSFLFIDIPRPEKVTAQIFSKLPHVEEYEVMFQPPFQDRFFVDFVHLNSEARVVSSAWLIDQIGHHFGSQASGVFE